MNMPALCRDCLTVCHGATRCPSCSSPRVLRHPELFDLSIAHIDCDAFYASVEKRDNPELRDKALIVGGGKRGVVSTCCYNARIKGVRSAMPMFQALKACPEAIVVYPRMDTYVDVSRKIKSMMQDLTPVVEPLSLDEAFLDLTGTSRLHKEPPAMQLARLIKQIEDSIGVSASVGLSHNKFLAKIASDLDKPRGFSIIGKQETQEFLSTQKVGIIWGIGPVARQNLENKGIRNISDILARDRKDLSDQFGGMGERLWHLARGLDHRNVTARSPVKSISNETTFFEDVSDPDLFSRAIPPNWGWLEPYCERSRNCSNGKPVRSSTNDTRTSRTGDRCNPCKVWNKCDLKRSGLKKVSQIKAFPYYLAEKTQIFDQTNKNT